MKRALGLLVGAILFTACASQPAAAPVTSTVTAIKTSLVTNVVTAPGSTSATTINRVLTTSSTVTDTVIATPTPPGPGKLFKVGDAVDLGVVKVTLVAVKIPAPMNHDPSAGNQWVSIEVKNCIQAVPGGSTISWSPWVLSDASSGQYPAEESKYEDSPKPVYPFAGADNFANGDCAEGWIMFQVPRSVKPTLVRYSTRDLKGLPLLVRWSI